jgi:hypothetical protein
MDLGDDGHILVSTRMAEDLRELSDDYKKTIKPVHDYSIKHGQTLLLYSVYGKGFGNPRPPVKGSFQRSKMGREVERLRKTTLYPKLEMSIIMKDAQKQLVHYKRTYEIANISDEPIYHVLHGITSDVDKTFDDLHVNIYDEGNRVLRVSSISIDRPRQKEFTTLFNKPIEKNEKGRHYTLEYDVEEPERYFENAFLVNCDRFIVNIDFPAGSKPPVLYEVSLETEEKKKSKIQPSLTKSAGRLVGRWMKKDVAPGTSFRFEW